MANFDVDERRCEVVIRSTSKINRRSGPIGFRKNHAFLYRVVAALLYVTTASAQENSGTSEQRAACSPDAFRLCNSYIPDATMVEPAGADQRDGSAVRFQ